MLQIVNEVNPFNFLLRICIFPTTVRRESSPSCPQSLQLSDLIVLLIQLSKQRHRVTGQTISRKTQPRTAINYLTCAPTCRLKFLPHKHALHTPPCSVTRHHAFISARIIAIMLLTCYHVPHVPALYRILPR